MREKSNAVRPTCFFWNMEKFTYLVYGHSRWIRWISLCDVMRLQTYWQICYSYILKKVHVRHQCTIRKQICTVNRVHITHIKDWINKHSDIEWQNRNDCRQTKLWIGEINKKWASEILRLNKRDISIITQMITGHANLKRHRFIMGVEDNPICEKCEESEETPEHLLTKCPFFARLRFEVLGIAFPSRVQIMESSLRTVLSFIKKSKRLENQY